MKIAALAETWLSIKVGALAVSAIALTGTLAVSGAVTASATPYSYTTSLNFPGADASNATGINNAGDIVGHFFTNGQPDQGYLYSAGIYTAINVPGATGTYPFGINDAGQIVGSYVLDDGSFGVFLATQVSAVPEPSTLSLIGLGLLGLGAMRRRRRDS